MQTYGRMKMIKKIARAAAFLLLLILILAAVSGIAVPEKIVPEAWMDARDVNALSILNEPEDSIDLLVLGDSESFTAVSPFRLWEKQRITSYVCGQSGQHIAEAYYMLKTALESQSPELVILETNEIFSFAGWVEESRLAAGEAKKYYFPVFLYHNRWKELCGVSEPLQIPADSRPYKGFEIRTGVRPYGDGPYMKETEESIPVAAFTAYYLKEMQALCESKGSRFLLLSIPSPRNWCCEKHNGVKACAEELGIPFLDLNGHAGEIGLDWQTDSYDDGDHLNLSGAEKVTDYLGKYLKKHYGCWEEPAASTADAWTAGLAEYKAAKKQ